MMKLKGSDTSIVVATDASSTSLINKDFLVLDTLTNDSFGGALDTVVSASGRSIGSLIPSMPSYSMS